MTQATNIINGENLSALFSQCWTGSRCIDKSRTVSVDLFLQSQTVTAQKQTRAKSCQVWNHKHTHRQQYTHTHINKLTQKQNHTTEHWKSQVYLSFAARTSLVDAEALYKQTQTVVHKHINKLTQKQYHTTEHWFSQVYLSFCRSNISDWRTDAVQTHPDSNTHTHIN